MKDPDTADKLMPKNDYYGTKRQPLDTNYYETFNKDNVLLIDAATDGGIDEVTEQGKSAQVASNILSISSFSPQVSMP